MKYFGTVILGIFALVCLAVAGYGYVNNTTGWGWFLIVAVLMTGFLPIWDLKPGEKE